MKLLLDGKYIDVGFWSFLKCNFITSITIAGCFYIIGFVAEILWV